MSIIHAIFENGVFKPTGPVNLPEKTQVDIPIPDEDDRANQEAIFSILRTSYPSGEHDVAERHNEHQP